jgi:hypothetical protein
MNQIVPMAFGEVERLATSIARSKLFGIQTPDQAIALMAIAQAEGRHPAIAARDYDIIQGRPAKKAEAMQRDFLEAGGKIEWHALSDDIADATFSHPQGGTVRITWDHKRAVAAGIGGKDMWKKYPRQMLRSRTVSEGVRTVWPMATSGCYVPEEVRDFSGITIDAEPVLTTAQAIQDDLPAEMRGDFQFMTKDGGRMFGTAAEWQARWEKLISDCQRIDALDKLRGAAVLNEPAIKAVEAVDAKAAQIVRTLIAAALAPEPEDAWPDADAANEPETAGAA